MQLPGGAAAQSAQQEPTSLFSQEDSQPAAWPLGSEASNIEEEQMGPGELVVEGTAQGT